MKQIDSQELKTLIDQGDTANSVIIDVRSKEEFNLGRIPGSKNVELGQLIENSDFLYDFDNIYLVCNAGEKSSTGQHMLRNLGFRNVVNISDGLEGWIRNKFNIEKED